MLVSLKELSKYVDISSFTAEEIADKLTFAGIEVEDIKHFSEASNIVIGQIIDIKDHPDSDHLHICQVDLGPKFGIKQIVCGAPNARKDLKVIVARVGAKLAGGFEIKDGVIRGVSSSGMLCSLVELGVDQNYLTEAQIKGIEELPSDAVVEIWRDLHDFSIVDVEYGYGCRDEAFIYTAEVESAYEMIKEGMVEAGYKITSERTYSVSFSKKFNGQDYYIFMLKCPDKGYVRFMNGVGGIDFSI